MSEVTRTETRIVVYRVPCPVGATVLQNVLAQAEDEWWNHGDNGAQAYKPNDWATVTSDSTGSAILIELNLDARA